jgi:rubrerythrin
MKEIVEENLDIVSSGRTGAENDKYHVDITVSKRKSPFFLCPKCGFIEQDNTIEICPKCGGV